MEQINTGSAPTGAGGDTVRQASDKINAALNEIQAAFEKQGFATQNAAAIEGGTVTVDPVSKNIICFLSGDGPIDEITIETQPLSSVSNGQQFTICSRIDINNAIWTGLPMENGPTSFVRGDSYSFRWYEEEEIFIKTASSL